MIDNLADNFWELPRLRGMVRQITKDVQSGNSLWILFPPWIKIADFQQAIFQEFEHLQLNRELLDLSTYDDNSAASFLRRAFPSLAKYQYLEQMVNEPSLPEGIFIANMDECATEKLADWVDIPRRWSDACRTRGARHSLIFLTPASICKRLELPPPDVQFSYRYLINFPTALEMRLLCRNESDTLDALTLWRENLISSVAGPDINLVESLWDVATQSFDSIMESLRQYAFWMNWTEPEIRENLRDWHPRNIQQIGFPNQKGKSWNLFGEGITWFTPEYGEEIHSAALALMNKTEEIRHRVWRGQAALILPMADEIRLRICTALANTYPNRFQDPAIDFGTEILEIGGLRKIIHDLPTNDRFRTDWVNIVNSAWWIRNQIAHYQPIPFTQFQVFWSYYHQTRNNFQTSIL